MKSLILHVKIIFLYVKENGKYFLSVFTRIEVFIFILFYCTYLVMTLFETHFEVDIHETEYENNAYGSYITIQIFFTLNLERKVSIIYIDFHYYVLLFIIQYI